jgi:hypothetical protein
MRFLHIFLLLWVIFALPDPGPADQNQCGSRSGLSSLSIQMKYGTGTGAYLITGTPKTTIRNLSSTDLQNYQGNYSMLYNKVYRSDFNCKKYSKIISVVDPDRVRSALFCRMDPDQDRHLGHADPDSADPDRYSINARHSKKLINYTYFFHKISICCLNYGT